MAELVERLLGNEQVEGSKSSRGSFHPPTPSPPNCELDGSGPPALGELPLTFRKDHYTPRLPE